MAKTDLEIAQECVMEPIEKVAAKLEFLQIAWNIMENIKLNCLLII